jgi:hypothetical protein
MFCYKFNFDYNVLSVGTCEFWAPYRAKMSCILVHRALNQHFSSKKVQIVFIKYDSHIKDNIRALTLISNTLNSHPLSDGLTFLTIRSTLG